MNPLKEFSYVKIADADHRFMREQQGSINPNATPLAEIMSD